MNYLLYGQDTYRSRKKLREIIDAYRTKAGSAFNLHRFDAQESYFSGLGAVAGGASLFGGTKKLIVIERPFASARHFYFVRDALKSVGGDAGTLVVLWDSVIAGDARKMLDEIEPLVQKTQVFDALAGDKLGRWIKQESADRGFDFSASQIARLAAMGGDDLWAINNEMEKMALSESAKSQAQSSKSSTDATVFQLGDAFFANPKAAVGFLLSLLARGEDEMRVFSYLAGNTRTLLLVKSYLDAGRPPAPSHKIHPFVLKKAIAAVRALSAAELIRRLSLFLEEDIKIKTGLARPADALMRMLTSRLASSSRVL